MTVARLIGGLASIVSAVGWEAADFWSRRCVRGTIALEEKAKELFDAGEDNISTAAYAVGFNNPKYFAYCFRSQYQQSPSEYVKEVKGQRKKNLQKS